MDISVLIEKMATLVIFMVVGYITAKIGITDSTSNKYFSSFVINVLLVATILNSVINVTPSLSTKEILIFIALLFLMFIILMFLGILSSHLPGIKSKDRAQSTLVVTFINNAFVGYPVVESVFGTEAVFYASLSNIPFNIFLYTFGVSRLVSDETNHKKFRFKDIINVPLITTFVAIAIFFLHIHIPELIKVAIQDLSAATVPISMIIIGTSLAGIPLKEAFGDWRAYVLSFIRLIIAPLTCWLVFRNLITNSMLLGTLIALASCPTAMIITVLCVQYGKDESLSSKTIFLSTLFSAFTIPLIFEFLLKI
jgi:predicted permease